MQVVIERATRNKRKCVTTVIGLDLFGVKLAEASKKFGKKFACGASVTKDAANKEQIDVQGDCMDDMAEFICKEWKEVRPAAPTTAASVAYDARRVLLRR